nr:recombination-associated protein RdgC [uncultured Rhodoferax sp.]
MLKAATLYRIVSLPTTFSPGTADLNFQAFAPCGASQEKSVGWVPPRGDEHGALLESVAGQWILKLMTETKTVPADVVRRKVDEQIKVIETTTGRKPGKKERRELTDDARLSLLPMAFTKVSTTLLWIDPESRTLVIDSASQAKTDEAVTALIKSVDGLALSLVHTETSPAAAMSHWLSTREAPQGFSVDRECELKATDESKAVVRYSRHALDTDEVSQHIAQGKVPTRVAMTWMDRASFVLSDALTLKKIDLLDVAFTDQEGQNHADDFDANVTIFTGEFKKLLPDLFEALGGEVKEGIE